MYFNLICCKIFTFFNKPLKKKSHSDQQTQFFLRFGEGEKKKSAQQTGSAPDKYCSIPINNRHFPNLL